MANICRTEININGTEEVQDWFGDIVKNMNADQLIEQFGSEGESVIDRIGSKWLMKYDWGSGYLSVETAWYPPDVFLKNIYSQVVEKDPNATIDGQYWDEAFSPIGVFVIDSNGYRTNETNIDVDMDDEYYWDEQVEPVFNELKKDL
jgi:hypothetical protein